MTKISSLRSLFENTQAGLDLLMEMTDDQLDNREKVAELTSALLQERESADELVAGLREVHIGSGPRGMGYKGKKAHLEALLDEFAEARDEAAAMLAKGGDARAEARVASAVEDIVPPSEEEEEEEIPSLADLIAENIDGSFTPEDETPDPTKRVASQHDSVRGLGLRKNAVRALELANIYSIGQLISQTPDYLLSLHQFGAASMEDVQIGLDALDFEWPNGQLFRATGGAGETPLGRLIRGDDLFQTEEEENRKEEEEENRKEEEKRKEVRRRNAAYARAYYRKNRKKILKQQSVYRRRTRVRIQDLEAKVSDERGGQ